MPEVFDYTKENAPRFREELYDLLRIPSVSTDPDYANEINRAANWLVTHLQQIGLSAERIDTATYPLVYAEWLGADAPTVLIYGHYDVQPAKLDDGWDSEPFEPVERDGFIYARGATDDKGQFFAHIKAIEALLRTEGRLPVNVKLLLEGEEETGSAAIGPYVLANAEKLAADVCLISDSSMAHIDQPMIVTGLRGVSAMELHVSGPKQDLHSGMFGGSVHNPLLALAQLLAQMHHPDGSIAVPGFYDTVRPLSDDERTELAKTPWTESDWREDTGAPQPWGESAYSLRERVGARPTLEITGIVGGYHQAGIKAIVPQKASAKIICRLVADQEPEAVFETIRAYVAQITPPTVRSEMRYLAGGPPAQVDINTPAMAAAVRAYEQGWGARPLFIREGGSIPIVAVFQQTLGTPVVMMGFGLNNDNLHAPNERFNIEMFHRGIDTSIHFLRECAGL